jgi:threonine/homoserine/homoserine lactone efflux protein
LFSFISGVLVGFFVALPVGAVAMICINRSLQFGEKSGYYSGLGAAAADMFYGFIAIYGLTAVSGQLLENQPVLHLAGGLCIIFIGVKMMSKKKFSSEENIPVDHETNIKDFVTTFIVTLAALSNIHSLFDEINFIKSTVIVSGIFCGSLLWWFILVNLALRFKKYISDTYIHRINIGSGFIISCFGLYLILTIKTV